MPTNANFARPCGWILLSTIAASLGCDAIGGPVRPTRQTPADFTTLRLPNASAAAVRSVAAAVFKEHFRVDNEASTITVLRSRPTETTAHADAEAPRVREVLSGRSNRRRELAELHVLQEGPDVMLRANVQVQRLDAAERDAFAQQRAADDRPAEQPFEHSSAATARRPEEWVDVGRNRQLEREMLNRIAEQVAGPTTTPLSATRPQVP
ncbi:MAG: hypothetical protein HY718_11160 [Planctomycetes bacterium]|nr:hypothetical protein [Planctomycetota bacterium]